jgi:hypothetical protein
MGPEVVRSYPSDDMISRIAPDRPDGLNLQRSAGAQRHVPQRRKEMILATTNG